MSSSLWEVQLTWKMSVVTREFFRLHTGRTSWTMNQRAKDTCQLARFAFAMRKLNKTCWFHPANAKDIAESSILIVWNNGLTVKSRNSIKALWRVTISTSSSVKFARFLSRKSSRWRTERSKWWESKNLINSISLLKASTLLVPWILTTEKKKDAFTLSQPTKELHWKSGEDTFAISEYRTFQFREHTLKSNSLTASFWSKIQSQSSVLWFCSMRSLNLMRNIHSVCNRDEFCMSSALTRSRCKKKTRMTLSPKTKRPFKTNKTKVTFQIIKLIKRVKKGRKSNRNEKGHTANEFEINLNKYKQNYHRLVCVFY